MKVNIIRVDNDGPHIACTLELQGNELRETGDSQMCRRILSMPVYDAESGDQPVRPKDGRRFLAALPAAYTGSRLRAELII